jgi:hypothetical protein
VIEGLERVLQNSDDPGLSELRLMLEELLDGQRAKGGLINESECALSAQGALPFCAMMGTLKRIGGDKHVRIGSQLGLQAVSG